MADTSSSFQPGSRGPLPGEAHTIAEAFGQIVWILSQSRLHRELRIKDLERTFMPAILYEQFRIFRFGPLPDTDRLRILENSPFRKEQIEQMPLGLAIWASLSPEAEQRMEQGQPLQASDWRSGGRLWLLELVSPFATAENKLADAMMLDLCQGPFKKERFFLHKTNTTTGERTKVAFDQHLTERS